MREIVLDTETTGLDPMGGDRIVEVGAVEILNGIPSGRTFHRYVNPERAMSADALAVHGIGDAFLADKPVFSAIVDAFLAFIRDDPLVIHNAAFDVGFLNMELGRTGRPPIQPGRVIDTLALARRKHPGGSNSLDALCQRYGIDNARRTKHGALLDAEILAEVYLELSGGRQAAFALGVGAATGEAGLALVQGSTGRTAELHHRSRLTLAEHEAHVAFVATLGATPVWARYRLDPPDTAAADEGTGTTADGIDVAGTILAPAPVPA